jgi:hypothetical protein
VTALSMPGEGDDRPDLPAPLSEASEGVLELPTGKAPGLVLSGAERTREALLASAIAVEHVRVVAPADSRTTAAYAARTVDNSRLLCGGDAQLHLTLLAGHRTWLRSLPSGGGLR